MNHDRERGQVLAEFAICSLAALTLFFGIIDYARALYTDHLVTNGARLATRYAMVNSVAACAGGTPDPLQAYVLAQSPGLNATYLTVTTACPGGNTGCTSTASPYDGTGCMVTVTVAYSFHFVAPFVSLLVIPFTSSSQTVMSQ